MIKMDMLGDKHFILHVDNPASVEVKMIDGKMTFQMQESPGLPKPSYLAKKEEANAS